jgi:hypothetical protein
VIAALAVTHQPGPYTLAIAIVACDKTHNLQAALNTAGGLSNPQVLGLLAYSPLATSIENGRQVSDTEIAAKVGVHSQNLANLLLAEKKLVPAEKASPSEWKRWWWVCIGGQVIFGLLVFTMRGPWSPRAAKRDFEEHERLVKEELEKLQREEPSGAEDLPVSA